MGLHLGIPSWVIVIVGGMFAGLIAMALVPGRGRGGFLISTVVGVVGGLLGKLLMPMIGLAGRSGNPLWNLLVAVVGAVILLVIFNLVTGHKGDSNRLRRPGPWSRNPNARP